MVMPRPQLIVFLAITCLYLSLEPVCGILTYRGRWRDENFGIETIPWLSGRMAEVVEAQGKIDTGFSCTMKTDKTIYSPGEPVILFFTLTNNNAQDMFVLKWHTPLEGMRNNYLEVMVDGVKVRYRGIMAKRGPPDADSYRLVAAGETIDAEVDITKGYSSQKSGKYTVQLKTRLMDVVPKKEGVAFKPNGFDDFNPVAISSSVVEFDVVG